MDVLILIGAGILSVALIARHIYKLAQGKSCCDCNDCSSCQSNVDKKEL